MEEYRNNSHKAKETQIAEKRAEKVVSGEVTRRKKTGFDKFVGDFIEKDINSVFDHMIHEVLLPALKNTIADAFTNGLNMLLFGESGNPRRKTGSNSRVSYRSCYEDARRPVRSSQRAVYDYDDVLFDSRGEAERVLDELDEVLSRYRMVKVADFYEAAGLESVETDYNYGWTSLRSASVIRVNDKFMIKLPRAIAFD